MLRTPISFQKLFAKVLPLICCLLVIHVFAQDAASAFIQASPNVRYQLIGTYDVKRLNTILTKEIPAATGDQKAVYTPAKNAVKLYRVEYSSVIPEQNNRPTIASGLIAIPVINNNNLPMVSYQHGTVFGKKKYPLFRKNLSKPV